MRIPKRWVRRFIVPAVTALARWAPDYCARAVSRPFLIVGCARSGTTLLLELLAEHPDVEAYPGEANRIWHPGTYPWRESSLKGPELPPFWADAKTFTRTSLSVRDEDWPRRTRAYFGAFQRLRHRPFLVNKSSLLVFMLEDLRRVFPDARLIHIVRDGRAVANSYAAKTLREIQKYPDLFAQYGYEPDPAQLLRTCATTWSVQIEEAERVLARMRGRDPGLFLEIRYEDLCDSTPECMRSVAEFMGLEPDRFVTDRWPSIRNMNYKFAEELSERDLGDITSIMAEGLRTKGYL
ncbi:MAG: sulfotransferase [Lentisphaerae bacterium]|nr:sulfotransferase [Lentisphaerota bacterium]